MGLLDDITKATRTVNKVTRTINSVNRAGKTVSNTVKKASDMVNGDEPKKRTAKKTTSKSSPSKEAPQTTKKDVPAEEPEKAPEVKAVAKPGVRLSEKSSEIVIRDLPMDIGEFKALPQASLASPFDTAALTLLALTFYQGRTELSVSMLEHLSGPAELDAAENASIASCIKACPYSPRSYFDGATPSNDYTPSVPYTVRIYEGSDSYEEEGYAVMYVRSSGSRDPRAIRLRQAKSGEWYLWEQDVLLPVEEPDKSDVWA